MSRFVYTVAGSELQKLISLGKKISSKRGVCSLVEVGSFFVLCQFDWLMQLILYDLLVTKGCCFIDVLQVVGIVLKNLQIF